LIWDIAWRKLLLLGVALTDLDVLAQLIRDELRTRGAARGRRAAAGTARSHSLFLTRTFAAVRRMMLPAIVIAGVIGIGVVTSQIVSSGVAPQFAYLDRPGQNAWTRALPTVGSGVQTSFTFYPGMARIPKSAAPDLSGRSFSTTALLEIPANGASGMIIAEGGLVGGWAFYVEDGRPVFHYNGARVARYRIAAERTLAPGRHTLMFVFRCEGSAGERGTGTILADASGSPEDASSRRSRHPRHSKKGLTLARTPAHPCLSTIICRSNLTARSRESSSVSARRQRCSKKAPASQRTPPSCALISALTQRRGAKGLSSRCRYARDAGPCSAGCGSPSGRGHRDWRPTASLRSCDRDI